MMEDFDIGAAPPGGLGELERHLDELLDLEQVVENLESDLKAAKNRLHKLKTTTVPEMMAEMGMDMIRFRGFKVSVDPFVSGTLPSDPTRRAAALAWLVDNGGEDLVKTHVGLEFGRSQHNEARNAIEELRSLGFDPDAKVTVHPQTLAAFARERIRNGDPIDTEVLGLYTGTVARVKK